MFVADKGSFWQRNKEVTANLIRAGWVIVGLRLVKVAVDVLDL